MTCSANDGRAKRRSRAEAGNACQEFTTGAVDGFRRDLRGRIAWLASYPIRPVHRGLCYASPRPEFRGGPRHAWRQRAAIDEHRLLDGPEVRQVGTGIAIGRDRATRKSGAQGFDAAEFFAAAPVGRGQRAVQAPVLARRIRCRSFHQSRTARRSAERTGRRSRTAAPAESPARRWRSMASSAPGQTACRHPGDPRIRATRPRLPPRLAPAIRPLYQVGLEPAAVAAVANAKRRAPQRGPQDPAAARMAPQPAAQVWQKGVAPGDGAVEVEYRDGIDSWRFNPRAGPARAQAASWRNTKCRMPPLSMYSHSLGVSTRTLTAKLAAFPSGLRCAHGGLPAARRQPFEIVSLGAIKAQRLRRSARSRMSAGKRPCRPGSRDGCARNSPR